MNPIIIRRKRALLRWASAHGVSVPRSFRVNTPTMGQPARRLLRVFQAAHDLAPTGSWNSRTLAALYGRRRHIIRHHWHWAHPLVRRVGRPTYVVLHNAAAVSATPEDIHSWHLARDFAGIGYHLYIRKDGSIHQGRPLWAIGAHTLHWNTQIGICCEGNYETERHMPPAQLEALRWAIAYVRRRTGASVVRGHREMPGNATDCPGRHFPLEAVR